MRGALAAADSSGEGFIAPEALEQALAAAGLKFTTHQVVSFCRKLERGTGSVLLADVAAALGV